MSLNNQDFGRNLGGLLKLYLFKTRDIISDISEELLLADAEKPYFTNGSARYRERQKRAKNGVSYDAQIRFVVPKRREEITNWIWRNSEEYFNAIFVDANNLVWRTGTKNRPLELEADYDSKSDAPGRNEYQFSFSGKLLRPAPIFDLSKLRVKQ